ncbi:hypothetical protein OAF16_01070 [Flavobacteriales bacterium]|nr:hypothetical protein [Flavobacteriales bacterium]
MKNQSIIKVQDKFRTNSLSLNPGGSEVRVVYRFGNQFIYDKIKYPMSYVARIHGRDIKFGKVVAIYCDDQLMSLDDVYKRGKDRNWY